MTVSVANRPIHGPQDLSDAGRLVLAFIDGGAEWLQWAAGSSSPPRNFADEAGLLAHGQQSLRQSPLLLLPRLGLWVSPIKLMTFDLADLRVVAEAESGAHDPAADSGIASILAAHGLLTQADFAGLRAFLERLGVVEAPLFQCLGLDETIALQGLTALPWPGDAAGTQREAAGFALDHARAPIEFSDYYRAYLALEHKLAGQSPEQTAAHAASAVWTLRPLIVGSLESPHVDGMVSPAEVATAVTSWLRQDRAIGFSRLSQGIARIIEGTPFSTEAGGAAAQIVERYLAEAQTFLSANEPTTGRISQDGRSCLMPVKADDAFAELSLGPDGRITLDQFRRVSPPAANA